MFFFYLFSYPQPNICACTICVCMCDTAIHETVPYLGDMCSLLTSSLHIVSLRKISTYCCNCLLLLCLCHKTGWDRYTLQKLNSVRVQTTKASQTWMWKWRKRKGKIVFHESESLCLFYTVNNWAKKIYILGTLFHLLN